MSQLISPMRTKPAVQWWQKVQQIVGACSDITTTWHMSIMSDHSQAYISANGVVVARIIPNIQQPNSLYLYTRASANTIEVAMISANLGRHFKLQLGEPFEYDGEGFTFYGDDAMALAALEGRRFYEERTGVEPAYTGNQGGKSGNSMVIKTPPPRLIN